MEEQFVWVCCNPEDKFSFAMIPPAPTKLYMSYMNFNDWWTIGGYLTNFLTFIF